MSTIGNHRQLVHKIADLLKELDSEKPRHHPYKPGIGPFTEDKLVREIAQRLCDDGIAALKQQSPDLVIGNQWGIEFKIVRPFGDNGKKAEHWSQNLLHPYPGNESSIGDALKLQKHSELAHKCVFVIGFEHEIPEISLDPLLTAFELLSENLMSIRLGKRVEEKRVNLVHPAHQTLRCVSWEVFG